MMKEKSKLANYLYSEGNVYKVSRFVFGLVCFYLIVALVAFGYGIGQMIQHGTTFEAVLRLLSASIPTLIVVFAIYGVLVVSVMIYEKMKK
jgi:lipopolysaccharide export LptBFGC system permease protein LptF